MLPRRIFLVDHAQALVAAWRETFAPHPEVVAERRDYFAAPADAMVAPGNSFAIMDGGLDRAAGGGRPIETLLCCGLCTGVGAMPPRRAAAQMRVAYRQVLGPPRPPSFREIHETHRLMRTAE